MIVVRIADVVDENKLLGCQTIGVMSDAKLPWRLSQTILPWHTLQIARRSPRAPSKVLKWRIMESSAADQVQKGLNLFD